MYCIYSDLPCNLNGFNDIYKCLFQKFLSILFMFKLIRRRAYTRHSLYFGFLGRIMIRSLKNRRQSERQPQNTGKVGNTGAAHLGFSSRVSTFIICLIGYQGRCEYPGRCAVPSIAVHLPPWWIKTGPTEPQQARQVVGWS